MEEEKKRKKEKHQDGSGDGNQRKINPEKKKHELMEAGNLHKRGKTLRISFLCWR